MADAWVLALVSVAAVSLLSLVGALTLTLRFLRRHIILLSLVAFAAGTLLGDSFIHLIPEAVEFRDGELTLSLSLLVLGGFLAFFLLEMGLRWQHAHGEEAHPHEEPKKANLEGHVAVAPFAWTNLIGDAFHNLVDGALIAAAYISSVPLGIGATIAVAAHEIPQELGDFAVLLRAGIKPRRALFYNFLSALTAVLGALIVLVLPVGAEDIEFFAIPLIAGGFLYIAAADLVPELHHHSEARYIPVILGGIVAGLAVMVSLLQFEAGA